MKLELLQINESLIKPEIRLKKHTIIINGMAFKNIESARKYISRVTREEERTVSVEARIPIKED